MANDIEMIAPISNAKKAEIERMGAAGLPDSPSEEGMTAEEIKRAFYEPENVLIAEINRIVAETNEALGDGTDALDAHTGDKNNPHEVTADQIPYGTGSATVKDALDAEVDTDKIADGAVTNAKLAGGIAQSKVTGLTDEYVAGAEMDGSVLKFKNKQGGVLSQTTPLPGAFRKVAESDRARGGTAGDYTFTLTAGKKYVVALLGECGYESTGHYFNENVHGIYFSIGGINQTLEYFVDDVGFAGDMVTLARVSGNTLTVLDWKYWTSTSEGTYVPGARHIAVFEVI